MIPVRVQISDVASVKEHFTFLGVVESLDQGDDGGLSATTGTAKGDNTVLLVVHAERNTLEYLHILLGGVSELGVPDFKSASDFTFDDISLGLAVNGRYVIDNFNDLVGGAHDVSKGSNGPGNHHEVPVEHGHVEEVGRELSNGDLTVLVEDRGDVDNSSHGGVEHELSKECEDGLDNGVLPASLEHYDIAFHESLHFGLLVSESFDSSHVGEGFFGHIVHLSFVS